MKQYHGEYTGRVVADVAKDGQTMTLTEPFTYVDPSGVIWHCPAGAMVSGASLPEFARSLLDGPHAARIRKALVIHDVACQDMNRPWEQVHEAFFHALRAAEVGGVVARELYAIAYHCGPRWPDPRDPHAAPGVEWSAVPPPAPWMTESDVEQLRTRIENRAISGNPMTLAEIRDFRPVGA